MKTNLKRIKNTIKMNDHEQIWKDIYPNLKKFQTQALERKNKHQTNLTFYTILYVLIMLPLLVLSSTISIMTSIERPTAFSFSRWDISLLLISFFNSILCSIKILTRPEKYRYYYKEKISSYEALIKNIDITMNLPTEKKPNAELFCLQITNAFDYIN